MRFVAFRRSLGILLALTALCAACSQGTSAAAGVPEDPYELPAFDLADYRHTLAEIRGTPVLVNIWASWCGPCREEAPLLAAAHDEYGDRVQFIGVDILDERTSARAFMREFGWTYPSVFDASGAIRDGLGLLGQPVTLFYDADGNLVDRWLGPLSREALTSGLERILRG